MTTILCLSGGLGNQLFQIAAAIQSSKGSEIIIDSYSNSPQISNNGGPAFSEFTFSKILTTKIAKRAPSTIQRIISFNLRSSLSERKTLKVRALFLISRLAVISYFSIRHLKLFHLISPQNVGDIPDSSSKKHVILNGYFQNSQLMDNEIVKRIIDSACVFPESPEVNAWIAESRKVSPIIVHFRIGDYSNHPGMGILDPVYFVEGIRRSLSQAENSEIWLFSDEPLKAANLLKEKGIENLVVVPTFDAASTLEIMRHGSAFVISNSTFSWWAATLRYSSSAKVFAPNPWFKGQESPKSIYMQDWILLRSWN